MMKHPENYVIRSARIKEFKFKDMAAFHSFLKARHERTVAAGVSKVRNRELSKGFNVIESAFKPYIVDSRASLAAFYFGSRAGDSLWSFLKAHRYLMSIIFAGSCGIHILTLTGHLPKPFALLTLLGVFPSAANLATCSVGKLRLLCRSFLPAYLSALSVYLCFGIAIAFSDVRSVSALMLLPTLLLSALTDAQNSANRRVANVYLCVTIATLATWGFVLYLKYAHDLTVYTWDIPGAVSSISTVQAMVVTPLLAVIPFFLMFLFVSTFRKGRYCSIRAPLREVSFDNIASTKEYFRVRRISAVPKISAVTTVSKATTFAVRKISVKYEVSSRVAPTPS